MSFFVLEVVLAVLIRLCAHECVSMYASLIYVSVRNEITWGQCLPVYYSFPRLVLDAYKPSCFQIIIGIN